MTLFFPRAVLADGRAFYAIHCCVCLSFVRNVLWLNSASHEQKLLLTAYRKSYMRNRLVPK